MYPSPPNCCVLGNNWVALCVGAGGDRGMTYSPTQILSILSLASAPLANQIDFYIHSMIFVILQGTPHYVWQLHSRFTLRTTIKIPKWIAKLWWWVKWKTKLIKGSIKVKQNDSLVISRGISEIAMFTMVKASELFPLRLVKLAEREWLWEIRYFRSPVKESESLTVVHPVIPGESVLFIGETRGGIISLSNFR